MKDRSFILSRSVLVVFRGSGIELPPVLVALGELLARTELFVVLIRHAQGPPDVFDNLLIRRRIIAAGRFVAAEIRVLPVGVDVAPRDRRRHAAVPLQVFGQLLSAGPHG